MKVFISQSGERSLALARTLESFLCKVIQNVEPWVSKTAIDKGARWPDEIRTNLAAAAAGIVCLTSENLDERWVLFEAGALSLKPVDRLWTLLLDVKHEQVEKPLSDFQHTLAEKTDVWDLVTAIHKTVTATEKSTRDTDLRDLFETYWDKELGPLIDKLRKQGAAKPRAPRPAPEMLEEVLETVRDLQRVGKDDNWRVAKTMLMLADMYQLTTGKKPPSMKELVDQNDARAALDALQRLRPYDGADLSWQPQYSNTPLPLRVAAAQQKPPQAPPEEPGQAMAQPITSPKPRPPDAGRAQAVATDAETRAAPPETKEHSQGGDVR